MKPSRKSVIFLDSVVFEEIQKFSWIISGVTTTPTFFKKAGINYNDFAASFREKFPDLELHVEALGPKPEETELQLREIMAKTWFDKNKVVIKIPAAFENLKIVSKYSKGGVRFNTHLIFNSTQAYLAALAGTAYVCPLIGRYADNMVKANNELIRGGENDIGLKLLKQVIEAVDKAVTSNAVKVMASSIRTVDDFQNSIYMGADVITVPTKILEASNLHDYTTEGINTFLKDMGY